jgi:hypothetical protein
MSGCPFFFSQPQIEPPCTGPRDNKLESQRKCYVEGCLIRYSCQGFVNQLELDQGERRNLLLLNYKRRADAYDLLNIAVLSLKSKQATISLNELRPQAKKENVHQKRSWSSRQQQKNQKNC